MKSIDITGERFGRLIALHKAYTFNKCQYWECLCDCGKYKVVRKSHLRYGKIKSCGCLLEENNSGYKHGLSDTRIMKIFSGILNRCYNKKEPAWGRYGGRGIKVCKEWLEDRTKFYLWSINNGYSDNLTIDRKDNSKDYSPENCRWVNYKTQGRNTRSNLVINYKGDKKCLSEWCEVLGLKYKLTQERLKRGWSVEKTFNTPEPLRYWRRR